MIVRIDRGALSGAIILMVYDDAGRCKKQFNTDNPAPAEESILFYSWFFAAQFMPGPVRQHGLLNSGHMMLRALTEGGHNGSEETPET